MQPFAACVNILCIARKGQRQSRGKGKCVLWMEKWRRQIKTHLPRGTIDTLQFAYKRCPNNTHVMCVVFMLSSHPPPQPLTRRQISGLHISRFHFRLGSIFWPPSQDEDAVTPNCRSLLSLSLSSLSLSPLSLGSLLFFLATDFDDPIAP